ncbi:hypothetical protein [Morganella morganii]|uniref:hypothetical protein n=1 Tax=Morganella morganii TaxID=582 RepID=UPI003CFCB97B
MTAKPQYRIRQARPADAALLPAVESSAGALFATVPGYEWIARSEGHSETAFRNYIANGNAWVAADSQDQRPGLCWYPTSVPGCILMSFLSLRRISVRGWGVS